MVRANSNQRREERVSAAFPVLVHVKDTDGRPVKATTLTDNLSQGGVFLQLPHFFGLDTLLFIFIQLSDTVRLAARGRVVRTENKNNGLTGIAVCFNNTRLMSVLTV